jgi:hypothetical protein
MESFANISTCNIRLNNHCLFFFLLLRFLLRNVTRTRRFICSCSYLKMNRPTTSTTSKSVDDTFTYPYNELLIWAVLTKRHQMALFFWERGRSLFTKSYSRAILSRCNLGEEAMAKGQSTFQRSISINKSHMCVYPSSVSCL